MYNNNNCLYDYYYYYYIFIEGNILLKIYMKTSEGKKAKSCKWHHK